MIAMILAAACAVSSRPQVPADSLVDLYDRGKTFAEFLAAAKQRRDTWVKNAGYGRIDPEQLARLQQLTGPWRILVVAEDWCGDSANTIPYLATFADSSGGKLQIRIVNSTDGKWVMEGHRTEDGRTATPTVIILSADGTEAGCWVERPSELAAWMRDNRSKMSHDELLDKKYTWLNQDRGKSTVREILDQIEHAGVGSGCGGNSAK